MNFSKKLAVLAVSSLFSTVIFADSSSTNTSSSSTNTTTNPTNEQAAAAVHHHNAKHRRRTGKATIPTINPATIFAHQFLGFNKPER